MAGSYCVRMLLYRFPLDTLLWSALPDRFPFPTTTRYEVNRLVQ